MATLRSLTERFRDRGPLLHVVLDGWGVGHEDDYNAIHRATLPNWSRLVKTCPYTQLWTHGPYVGLPDEQDLGGSEVGHMTMGAGEIKEQGPTLIQNLIRSGAFFENPVLGKLIQNCVVHDVPLHLIGLLSDGNIHSHIGHTSILIEHAFRSGVRRCYVHALLDGRDVFVQSATDYTDQLEKLFHDLKLQNPDLDYAFASGGGREQVTMDRDQNWAKVEAGWNLHVRGQSENQFTSIARAIEHFRKLQPDVIDQDLPGFIITRNGQPVAPIGDGHSVIFTNFRADRALEFTTALLTDDFPHFDRSPRPNVVFAGMAQYDQDNAFPEDFLVGTAHVENPFGQRILELGLKQFRLAETQKFAHVTFFYNGGRKEPLDPKVEHYHFIPSDQVQSFAEKPAMKAREIAAKGTEWVRSGTFDYGLINFANPDMVGHSGNLEAATQAVEVVDEVLGKLLEAVDAAAGVMVITADHGNADEMRVRNKKTKAWEPSTKHSLNPVPFLIYDPKYDGSYHLKPYSSEHNNNLSHVAATNFVLLGKAIPDDLAPSLFTI